MELEILHLPYRKTYRKNHQTWDGGKLWWGDPNHQVTGSYDQVVIRQIKNLTFAPPQDLWPLNLAKKYFHLLEILVTLKPLTNF